MKHISHIRPTTDQEKQELLEEVAQLEALAASIKERMRRMAAKKGETPAVVTSITARLRRLDMPAQDDEEEA